ncbi:MAG: hypothetical protein KIH62_002500 [Candidatus Kerfeldbacteria bacterium]|nr:hypothetical protein [Candidatus Kerfeldbacteria bacterium]
MKHHRDLRHPLEQMQRESRHMRLGETREGAKRWYIYRRLSSDYEREFENLFFERDGIRRFVSERKNKGLPVVIGDFMSDGHALSGFLPDAGLAISLRDNTNERIRAEYVAAHISVLEGDLSHAAAWREIDRWLDVQAPDSKKFDLILCCPHGPMTLFSDDPRFLFVFLQRMWRRLNPDGGMLLTQVPRSFSYLLESWERTLHIQGIDVLSDMSMLKHPRFVPKQDFFSPQYVEISPHIRIDRKISDPERLPVWTEEELAEKQQA